MNQEALFAKLFATNVNDHTEQKNGLTYLSWAWAWAEFKKVCPDATYEIVKQENGLPYAYDPNTGYMVYTRVTACGVTHEMWLPVMDSGNNAMKAEPYEVSTKYKTYDVSAATMFDVNKAIMRCLTKNLAMFGLGLYIYAGEDLPEDAAKKPAEPIRCVQCGEEIRKAKKGNQEITPAQVAAKTGGKCMKCYRNITLETAGEKK